MLLFRDKKYVVRQILEEIMLPYTYRYGGFFGGGKRAMSKILKVTANDDFTLRVEFEHGNTIIFNMRQLIKTMPFYSLNDPERFRDITLEEKAIRWPDAGNNGQSGMPVRLTVDNILFTIRE